MHLLYEKLIIMIDGLRLSSSREDGVRRPLFNLKSRVRYWWGRILFDLDVC